MVRWERSLFVESDLTLKQTESGKWPMSDVHWFITVPPLIFSPVYGSRKWKLREKRRMIPGIGWGWKGAWIEAFLWGCGRQPSWAGCVLHLGIRLPLPLAFYPSPWLRQKDTWSTDQASSLQEWDSSELCSTPSPRAPQWGWGPVTWSPLRVDNVSYRPCSIAWPFS